jgi:hypothetical protein
MTSTGWCPRCGAEYRPGYTSCADCHVALVDRQPDPEAPDLRHDPDRRPDPNRRFVELRRVPALEASMIVNRLRADGVTTANLGAEPIYRSLSFTEGVPIVVADDELAMAQEVLAGLDAEE